MTDNDLIEALVRDLDESLAVQRRMVDVGTGLAEIALSLAEQLDAALSNVRALKATVKELQAVIHEDAKQTSVVTVVRKPIPQVH